MFQLEREKQLSLGLSFYSRRWFSYVHRACSPKIFYSKALETDKRFYLHTVLSISSKPFIIKQSITTRTRSSRNICTTTPRRVATSPRRNSYSLSSRTLVDGWDIDFFVDCNENAKPIDDTTVLNILWFLLILKQLSHPLMFDVLEIIDHHQPFRKRWLQISSD